MTREIKFRCWDKRDKKMHEVFGITTISVCYDENAMMPAYEKLSNDIILMQYTGLKDKNGKEIYEGDIVRYMILLLNEEWEEEKMVIKYDESKLALNTPLNHHFKVPKESIEIIGNIYENPELLSNNLLKSDEK